MAEPLTTGVEVHEVMSRDLHRVSPTTPVGEALDLMSEKKISALPVVDEGDHCIGIVTVTDIIALLQRTEKTLRSNYPHFDDCLWAVDLVQRNLDKDPVRNIMSEVMVTISPDLSVERAAKTMSAENVHHLPVITDRKLVGFLSSIDVARVVAGDIE
jgi:CBS domain-containing protein